MRKRLLIAASALALSLVGGEVLVRKVGKKKPWRFFGGDAAALGLPKFHDSHPTLGWTNTPGDYVFPLGLLTQQPERGDLTVTIDADSMRASAPADLERLGKPVAFIGCSFTFGWAVEDHETFVWRVQENLPEVRAINMGVGGYGSYQSLLRLEQELATEDGVRPELVVYGLISGHAERDASTYTWQRAMSVGGTEPVPVPWVELAEGELARRAPQAYPVWPLSTRSALVAWAADRYAQWRADGREQSAIATHVAVVVEMDRVLSEAGIPLLVVLLESYPAATDEYERELEAASIDWVSCLDARSHDPAFRVPIDNHPNADLHAIWADCITAAVAERLQPD